MYLHMLQNVKREGERLQEQAKNLVPVLIPGTDIGIECIGCPSLVDGTTLNSLFIL